MEDVRFYDCHTGAAYVSVFGVLNQGPDDHGIAALVGKTDFSAVSFNINGSCFELGDFINALVSFLLVAAGIYFVCSDPN